MLLVIHIWAAQLSATFGCTTASACMFLDAASLALSTHVSVAQACLATRPPSLYNHVVPVKLRMLHPLLLLTTPSLCSGLDL